MYDGVELKITSSFGWSSLNIDTNGLFISDDDQSIVYPIGGHLARYDIVTQSGEFIPRVDPHLGKITSIASGLSK